MYEGLTQTIRLVIRRHGTVAAYAVMGILVVLIATYFFSPTSVYSPIDTAEIVSTSSAHTLSESEPVRLRIPAIHVDTPFAEPLGLDENREVEVPEGYEEVGWYKHGPTPGELGPAVVLGHVDSFEGPAVFYRLGQLKEGDEIFIEREDGTTAAFLVTTLERYDQEEFPTKLIYGNIDHAGLRLITCTGVFDHGIQRYSHNLVVYAKLVSPEEGNQEPSL